MTSKCVCLNCGQDTKQRTFTGPGGHQVTVGRKRFRASEICVDCFFWSHIPADYAAREVYRGGNATRRPLLGVAWLDECRYRLTDALMGCKRRPRLRTRVRRANEG